jgi:hypothetical protein
MPDLPTTIDLHLYCHGLGDCHLLEFPRAGGRPYYLLIDCGLHSSASGSVDTIREVVTHVNRTTGGKLDAIAVTHEHWDHISGFTYAQDLFKQFTEIGEIWFSWAENPADPDARQLDKFKDDAGAALASAAQAMTAIDRGGADSQTRFGQLGFALNGMLGFQFGVAGEKSRAARDAARDLAPKAVRYLDPGTVVPLPPELAGYRIHVLAPPRDRNLLGLLDAKSDSYAASGGGSPSVAALSKALEINEGWGDPADDPALPFAPNAGVRLSSFFGKTSGPEPSLADRAFLSTHYAGPAETRFDKGSDLPTDDQQWRRIDNDWLGVAGELALQLDSKTNNTSLVLAIEIVATGRVLIFAADAQRGNWRSWGGTQFRYPDGTGTTGADLLARTVFYKVGHHGSSNATMSIGGLEAMTSVDLTAFVPTDEVMAKKVKWGDMPAKALVARLAEKTGGRFIRSDDARIKAADGKGYIAPGGSLKSFEIVDELCANLTVG